jgi:hypothetical protein
VGSSSTRSTRIVADPGIRRDGTVIARNDDDRHAQARQVCADAYAARRIFCSTPVRWHARVQMTVIPAWGFQLAFRLTA